MVKKILLGLVLVIMVLVVVIAMQPSDFKVTRSTRIAAPPAVVFAQVNDFHAWQAWSPWAKRDPSAEAIFEGPAAGTGAVFKWSGNSEVGQGAMTITESQPNERVLIKLDFQKPFEATNLTEFTFKPVGDQTEVTWTMSGKSNFIGKAICLFMDMDTMVGGDFENGLAAMQTIAESGKTTATENANPRELTD